MKESNLVKITFYVGSANYNYVFSTPRRHFIIVMRLNFNILITEVVYHRPSFSPPMINLCHKYFKNIVVLICN